MSEEQKQLFKHELSIKDKEKKEGIERKIFGRKRKRR